MGRTMAWRTEGRLNVVVHSSASPTNLEWARFLNDIRPHADGTLRVLVVSHGGGPDGAQRRALAETFPNRDRRMPVAVVTASVLVRGIVAAVHWFNPHIKAFGMDQMPEACRFLDLTPEERALVISLRAELERKLADESMRAMPGA